MSARALKCTHKQTHIVWPIEEAFSGWNQNNLAVFCRSPLWRRSVSLQYFLLSFSHQYCLKSFFFFTQWKLCCCLSRLQEKNDLWNAIFLSPEREKKRHLGKWKLVKLSVLLVMGLMNFWFYYGNCEWERKRDGWRERELMEAEICHCHSFLNSWLKQQMWSRYIIALLCRAKTA